MLVAVHPQKRRKSERQRLRELLRRVEGRLAARLRESIEEIRGRATLREIADLVAAGDLTAAAAMAEGAYLVFSGAWEESFQLAARGARVQISNKLNRLIDFDQTNVNAVRTMRQARLQHAKLEDDTKQVIRQVMRRGVERGTNPIEVARTVRRSIGLTPYQDGWVANYERLLRGDKAMREEALTRQLRDRRFDRTVRGDKRLTSKQIARMVERYRERAIKYRSEVIARTESLRATHLGNHEMYRQAVERRELDEREIEREWVPARVPKWRDHHLSMRGQKRRGLSTPFRSGRGNPLRYPGDERAPASETVQCRCVVVTRLKDPED